MNHRAAGFSLPELLLVVALAAIVGAIAIGNHRTAQAQSLTARAKAELRELAVALEAYDLDRGILPPDGDDYLPQGSGRGNPMYELNRDSDLLPFCAAGSQPNNGFNNRIYYYRTYKTWTYLTTPVAYIAAVRIEPYSTFIPYGRQDQSTAVVNPPFMLLTSVGPDRTVVCTEPSGGSTFATSNLNFAPPGTQSLGSALNTLNNLYDPTNGAVSWGEIYRFAVVKNRQSLISSYGSLLPGDFTPEDNPLNAADRAWERLR